MIAAVSIATFSGCVYAHQAAPTYARDRTAVTGRLAAVWPYVYRAAVWGVAAAGLGALLAEAMPSPLQKVAPSRLSTTSLLAVTFASIGIAAGILETWRETVGGRKDYRERVDDWRPVLSGPAPATDRLSRLDFGAEGAQA